MLKICITGHRNLKNTEEVRKNIAYSIKYFKEIDSDIIAMSALASGADTLFAEEAIKQQISLKILLPFNLVEYKKDFTPKDLIKLESILKNRNFEITETSEIKTRDERDKAYLKTGKILADSANVILAVWDGKPSSGKGGTGDIIDYARLKNKEVHIIKAIKNSAQDLTDETEQMHSVFEKLDNDAIKYKERLFERAWIGGIIAGILAVVCFASNLSFHFTDLVKFIFSGGEIIFLFISFLLLAVFAKKWKKIFLKKRRDAEYLRTPLLYKEAGIPVSCLELSDFTPDSEILEIEKKIGKDVQDIKNFPNAKRAAWCLAQNQIEYHQNKRIFFFNKKLKTWEPWLEYIKIIFFIVAVFKFLFECSEYFDLKINFNFEILQCWILFLFLVLPSLYAGIEGVKFFGEWKRNVFVSKKILTELEKLEKKILLCNNKESLLTETKNLRTTLEIENNDWAVRFDARELGARP